MVFWVSWLRLTLNRKDLFYVWFLVLWGVFSWALVELTFPRMSYMPNVFPVFVAIFVSVLVLIVMGRVLYSYFGKNELGKRSTRVFATVFLIATFTLIVVFAPYVITSLNNKARVQWYIDDLKSQGFTVEYHAQYPYNRGPVSHVYSYENFTSLAKELNCTWVGVYGGAPSFFVFFFPSATNFLINEHGQYLLFLSW